MDPQTLRYVAEHQLDGVVRISQDEYAGIPNSGYLAHFNLEKTDVVVGGRYALPRILRHGFVDVDGKEIFPQLSFEDIYMGECVEVQSHVPYEALAAADFQHSFTHIQNTDDLKRTIVARYSKSKPTLSTEVMLALGVSRMLLVLSKAM